MSSSNQKAPGLVYRKRRNGAQAYYWIARKDAVDAGYQPKSVRLHHEIGDPLLAARCHVLQAEMLTWLSDAGKGRPAHYDGTFASLVRFYETHPDSPYFELKPRTQRVYSKTLELLMKHKGKRTVAAVDGSDVRRWYKELSETKSQSWAYFTVNVLKAVLSFGTTKRFKECSLLRAELREAKFNGGTRRTQRITFAQVVAFRKAAHEMGLGWMALTLTLQFLGLRRRDVIGEYIRDETAVSGIRSRNKVWRDGLTFDCIKDGVIRKMVSKTEFTSAVTAVHTIADYPDLVEELALIERRVGPIVINPRTGMPPTENQCRRAFRKIARKAGIPDDVWEMDARAGANSEAYEAGATEEEAMALLTHTERDTNRGYLRTMEQQSHRAAVKRVKSRSNGEGK
jgi:hypothetical protein